MKMGSSAGCSRSQTLCRPCTRHRYARRLLMGASLMRSDVVLRRHDIMRVVGPAPRARIVEIVIEEAPLRKQCCALCECFVAVALGSAGTAVLVYLSLHYLFVRPCGALLRRWLHSARTENPSRVLVPPCVATSGIAEQNSRRCRRTSRPCCSEAGFGTRLAVSKIQPRSAQFARIGTAVSDRSRIAGSYRSTLCPEADARARARNRLLSTTLS